MLKKIKRESLKKPYKESRFLFIDCYRKYKKKKAISKIVTDIMKKYEEYIDYNMIRELAILYHDLKDYAITAFGSSFYDEHTDTKYHYNITRVVSGDHSISLSITLAPIIMPVQPGDISEIADIQKIIYSFIFNDDDSTEISKTIMYAHNSITTSGIHRRPLTGYFYEYSILKHTFIEMVNQFIYAFLDS